MELKNCRMILEEPFSESYETGREAHDFLEIDDASAQKSLSLICSGIKKYRQYFSITDTMLGDDVYRFNPRLYLIADKVGYRIEAINWENYESTPLWKAPISLQKFNEPVFYLFRIKRPEKLSDSEFLEYMNRYHGPDSMNSEGGHGWYSRISGAKMKEYKDIISRYCEIR